MARLIGVAAVASSILVTALTHGANAHDFGELPYGDVIDSTDGHGDDCAGITRNELAALMLAITWPEATGGAVSYRPAPMTMSRVTSTKSFISTRIRPLAVTAHSGIPASACGS